MHFVCHLLILFLERPRGRHAAGWLPHVVVATWKRKIMRLMVGPRPSHVATWKELRHCTSSTCTSLILMSYCLSIKTIKSYGNMGGASFNMNMADVKWVVLEIHFSVLKCNEPKLFTVPSKQPKPRNKYCRSTTCPPPRTY